MCIVKIIVLIAFIILVGIRFNISSKMIVYLTKLKLKLELYKKRKGW